MFLKNLSSQVFKVPEKIPLRLLLVMPFLLQIFAIVGFTGWLSLRNGQKAVYDVTTQLHSEITEHLEQYLNSYLKVPQIANQLNADAIRLGLLNIKDFPAVERYFWHQLQTFNSLQYLSLGKANGDYIQVLRENTDQLIVKVKDVKTDKSPHTYRLSNKGQRTELLGSEPNYNPQTSFFYQEAVTTGKPTWTPVYLRLTNNELSADAIQIVTDKNGANKSVFNAGLSLSKINGFLSRLKISRTGQTFIVERSGLLIASSTAEKLYQTEKGESKQIKASQSSNYLTKLTASYVTQYFGDLNKINRSQQLSFNINNRQQFLRITPLRESKRDETEASILPDWLIVVVVPEADFQESIDANTRSTILLCLAIWVLATLLAMVTYRWITQPILRLTEAATALSRGEWNQTVPIEQTDELGVLARAFNEMALQLQESFTILSQRQASLAEAQKIAHLGSWELDLTTQTITGSEELLRIFGREGSEEPLSYDKYLQQIHPDDAEASEEIISLAIALGKPYEFDCRIKRLDGSIRHISTKGEPALNDKSEVIRCFGTVIDITERELAALALQQAKIDLEIRVQERTVKLRETLEQLQKSEVQLKEQALQLQTALRELQETQTQLVHTEKMSSLGQLVAGVAHEINNPVSFIYGNLVHARGYSADLFRLLHLYQEQYPSPPPNIQQEIERIDLDFLIEDFPQLLGSMQVGAERIREIVQSLRNFSRYDESQMKEVNLHEGIDSTLMILQSRLTDGFGHHGVEVIKEYGKLPLIECYAGQINQVFMNILSNAIDALEANRVRIEGEEVGSKQKNKAPCIMVRTGIRERRNLDTTARFSPFIFIEITDNGCGMIESIRSRIFDPFFTTKPIGSGTGLGLTTSYQIVVERHKGMLGVTSQAGEGTEFVIELPLRQSLVRLSG